MCKRFVVLLVAVGLSLITSTVVAQCGCSSVQTTCAPDVPSCTANYMPRATYYPPAPYVTYNTSATPQVAYYAPAAQAQPYAMRYVPAVQPYVAYYGVAGRSLYGTPKVYVPGEPVRNVLRAITP